MTVHLVDTKIQDVSLIAKHAQHSKVRWYGENVTKVYLGITLGA